MSWDSSQRLFTVDSCMETAWRPSVPSAPACLCCSAAIACMCCSAAMACIWCSVARTCCICCFAAIACMVFGGQRLLLQHVESVVGGSRCVHHMTSFLSSSLGVMDSFASVRCSESNTCWPRSCICKLCTMHMSLWFPMDHESLL